MRFERSLCTAALLSLAPLSAQTIQITSVPAYGTAGSISGTVTGVRFASHRVAVYIFIDGSGWWTKPTAANRTVPIQPNGTFTASVYSCCLDDRATIYCAALLAPGVTPPLATNACSVPPGLPSLAIDYAERFGRTIQFAGRNWAVKDAPSVVGPGNNLFSDDPNDVFVDPQGRLHLRVVRRANQWWCSEVVLLDDVGHGTYWFTTESQVGSLDPNLTFGAFTWDSYCDDTSIPTWPHREIDFEDSRWGNPAAPNSSQVVVQPWSVSGNTIRYNTPPLTPTPTLTRFFTWTAGRVDFVAVTGLASPCVVPAANVLHASSYVHDPSAGHRVPPAGREKFRFNLWINSGGAPRSGQTEEIIISDFRFSRSVGAFGGGCGVNPPGSATVLAGTPSLGGTVTLGVDNPAGTQRPGSLALLVLGVAPSTSFPCGALLPGFGMSGPAGELLVDLAAPHVSVPGGPWAGPGSPVAFALAIPNVSSLVGVPLYAQGVVLDPGGPTPLGLANGFELCLQP